MGADAGGIDGSFVGDIDEARVWNREISAGEIWNAYHGGRVNLNGLVVELWINSDGVLASGVEALFRKNKLQPGSRTGVRAAAGAGVRSATARFNSRVWPGSRGGEG